MRIKNLILTLGVMLSFCFTHLHAQDVTETTHHGHNSFEFEVKVINRDSKRPVDNVLVALYEVPSYDLVTTTLTTDGKAYFYINPLKEYTVETCKRKYLPGGLKLFNCHIDNTVFCISGSTKFDFKSGGGHSKPNALLKAKISIDSIAVGKTFKLENVYYDLARWYLRNESKRELNKLYRILNEFPSMTVELASHTDSRGDTDYNAELSGKRAQSCYKYLIDKGINPVRIIPMGYGESQTTNGCDDGTYCQEDQHQKNRRTEFTILSFEGEACVITGESRHKPE